MSTIRCDIVSAEEEIFHGAAAMVIATGEMGELGIAPRHAPLITRLKPGHVRVILEGQTRMHAQVYRAEERLRDELRALAADLGDVWLEKLSVATRPPAGEIEALDVDSPLAGLMQAIAQVRLDSSSLSELVPDFEALRTRLPAELLGTGDPFSPDEEALTSLRGEVRELLMARLQESRHEN